MKNNLPIKNALLAATLSLSSMVSFGQQQPKLFGKTISASKINPENGKIRCASSEYEEYLQINNPGRSNIAQFEQWMTEKKSEHLAQRSANSTNAVITIPVVVHVIHNGDQIGANENIDYEQVLSQIEVLNQDYRKMSGTPGWNTNPVGVDTEIQFALAVVDPDGFPTDGVDRVNLSMTYWNESSIESNMKPNTIWDPTRYFNLWVCNFGGDLSDVLGYAQFPSQSGLGGLQSNEGSANTDGVVIHYKYFGSSQIFPQGNYEAPYDRGRTATHEIGHALGLRHVDGDNYTCQYDANDTTKDYCPDTPVIKELNYSCGTINSCPSAPGNDMVQNYLDYTPDQCMNIFTQDQKGRMLTVLANSPRRKTLVTSNVWLKTEAFDALAGMSVYPNPANNVINISAPDELPESFVVYNTLGQVVASAKISSEANLSINVSAYNSGIYFIKVNKGSQEKTFKFIKN